MNLERSINFTLTEREMTQLLTGLQKGIDSSSDVTEFYPWTKVFEKVLSQSFKEVIPPERKKKSDLNPSSVTL